MFGLKTKTNKHVHEKVSCGGEGTEARQARHGRGWGTRVLSRQYVQV